MGSSRYFCALYSNHLTYIYGENLFYFIKTKLDKIYSINYYLICVFICSSSVMEVVRFVLHIFDAHFFIIALYHIHHRKPIRKSCNLTGPMIHAVCDVTKCSNSRLPVAILCRPFHQRCRQRNISTIVRTRFSFSWTNCKVPAKKGNGKKPRAGSSTKRTSKRARTVGVGLTLHRCPFIRCWICVDAWKRVWFWWIWRSVTCPALPIESLNRSNILYI